MNKTTLWMLVAILVICGAATVRAQYPGPFLTDEIRPNGILFLPVPPDNVKDSIGGKFYNDWWYYQARKEYQRVKRQVTFKTTAPAHIPLATAMTS